MDYGMDIQELSLFISMSQKKLAQHTCKIMNVYILSLPGLSIKITSRPQFEP